MQIFKREKLFYINNDAGDTDLLVAGTALVNSGQANLGNTCREVRSGESFFSVNQSTIGSQGQGSALYPCRTVVVFQSNFAEVLRTTPFLQIEGDAVDGFASSSGEGYVYSGSVEKSSRNDLAKMHHCLVPFDMLSEQDKAKDDD